MIVGENGHVNVVEQIVGCLDDGLRFPIHEYRSYIRCWLFVIHSML